MAPGVDVLAAVSPASGGKDFNFESGTSMAAPHIAGIAALLKQLHPTWSPMMIKSALMTSASVLDNKGNPIPDAGAFDYGSGQVTPNSAADPGLVYDSGPIDWTRFLCGTGELPAGNLLCALFGTRDPSDLNTPNIAIGDLPGIQTVTRTVTNVGKTKATYNVAVTAPAGVTTTVSPTKLTIAPGRSASYKVSFTRTTAPNDIYTAGNLVWSDGTHSVRSQLVVRPVGARAVSDVTRTGTSGSVGITVTPGYTGNLTTTVGGLVAGNRRPTTLVGAGGTSFPSGSPAAGPHTAKYTVTVPAGTSVARFATFDSDVAAGTDLDLFVYNAGTNTLVGSSTGATAQEQVQLLDTAGTFDVYVDQFALPAGTTQQVVPEFDWAVGAATGNLTATPTTKAGTTGKPFTLTATWTGLTADTHYLGTLTYTDGTNQLNQTVLAVNA
jgi:subtilisin family serine protease